MSDSMPELPLLRGHFAFRLGAPSFVLPADYLSNVRFLARYVDEIQLLFFEKAPAFPHPSREELLLLRDCASEQDTQLLVHLPIDISLAETQKGPRQADTEACLRLIDRLQVIEPIAYVIHVENNLRTDLSDAEQEVARKALTQVTAALPERRMLCIENTVASFQPVLPLVRELGLSTCFDLGHALLYGEDPHALYQSQRDCLRLVHLHGVRDGRDHQAIHTLQPEPLCELLAMLSEDSKLGPRTLLLELFALEPFASSLHTLKNLPL